MVLPDGHGFLIDTHEIVGLPDEHRDRFAKHKDDPNWKTLSWHLSITTVSAGTRNVSLKNADIHI